MGGVDDDDVHALLHQRHGPVPRVTEEAHRCAHAEPALLVLGGVGVLVRLDEVLECDEALEPAVGVDDGQLLHLVPRQEPQRLLAGDTDGGGDQRHARHDLADGAGGIVLEAHVAVGDDADQGAVGLDDRGARDAVGGADLVHLPDRGLGADGDRVADHPGLGALHLVHHLRLVLDGQVAVQDADAALAGHGDGHPGLGHGVHGRRRQGYVEPDPAGELGASADLRGDDVGLVGLQQHIVEREPQRRKGAGYSCSGQFVLHRVTSRWSAWHPESSRVWQ